MVCIELRFWVEVGFFNVVIRLLYGGVEVVAPLYMGHSVLKGRRGAISPMCSLRHS